eukprot:NODE_598_length_2268_cov_103.971562_g568_i0.p2 GENE.NODE_598_length_2268_cov_103.971562_g568_i0~~NODE_598_length_2268_cov_103.971562_g568_i0.p2  ORF type:complete len:257 (-),score=60.80 NODE_598_length_2268_cov_103.971562_g568_i0:146-916(-)
MWRKLLHAFALVAVTMGGTLQCGNTTTHCPAGGACCPSQYSPTKFGCRLPVGTTCCKPGPSRPASTTLKNCLVIGDSVSIGYTGVVASLLKEKCFVQHGPWDVSDGGALNTAYGQDCLDNWLVDQQQATIKWDVIQFNFGLHELDNSTSAEAIYRTQLTNIADRLVKTGAKILYATTTPFMPLHTKGDMVVNQIAREVVAPHHIPIVDLYSTTTAHCGNNYTTCDWCRKTPCSYHYNSHGETAQAKVVAAAFEREL